MHLTLNEYQTLVEQAPIMIWRCNRDAKCDYFNDRWLEFTGRTLNEELGDGWATGVHADDMDRCLKIFLTSFKKQEVFEMEYRLKRNDGEYRWLFDRGVPFKDESGEFKGFIGSCIDVTDRVVAQEELRLERDKEIRTLQGFIPICSYCKQIRKEDASWEQMEKYISEHSNAQFSHGICPDCQKKNFPKYNYDENN